MSHLFSIGGLGLCCCRNHSAWLQNFIVLNAKPINVMTNEPSKEMIEIWLQATCSIWVIAF